MGLFAGHTLDINRREYNRGRRKDVQDTEVPEQKEELAAVVALTFNEALYLDDQLTLQVEDPAEYGLDGEFFYTLRSISSGAATSTTAEFLLKLGGVLLELLHEEDGHATVDAYLSEQELWVVRELAQSSVLVGNEKVGLNLKIKVHEALQSIAAEKECPLCEVGGDENVLYPNWKDQLKRMSDPDASPNQSASETEDNSEPSSGPETGTAV